MTIALFRKTLFGILFLCSSISPLQATHIIGGELNYTCLGDNQYEISLTVYRDCYLGEALLDDTAYVAVYDQLGLLVQTVPILLGEVDTVSQVDECLLAPVDICVETTVYKDIIELVPRIGGYHIAYQRCCRNATILNIVDPLNTGATYDIILTEAAMSACNASPQIKAWPPTYICANRPLLFDHSASDRENDSLVYKLCTPFTGGISLVNPRPRPAFPPPYKNIVWNAPIYNLDNLLGGIPLVIDPKTGILTGTPNTIGQFVVGVCVEEYRNGKLISETRRDFQYNVVPCQDVSADFSIPESQCEELTVTIENRSIGAKSYQWEFIAGDNILATSLENTPIYTFPDTGTYIVRLIVDKNSTCIDSIEKQITLIPNSLEVSFSSELVGCEDSLFLQLHNTSISTTNSPITWQWTVVGTVDQFTSSNPSPRFNIKNNQTFDIQLKAISEDGCTLITTKTIEAALIPDNTSMESVDTIIACNREAIELNPNFNPNLSYSWTPQAGLDNPNSPNPTAKINNSVIYTVAINDPSNGCLSERNIFVKALSVETDIDFNINYLSCTEEIIVQLNPNLIDTYQGITWTIDTGSIATITSTEDRPIFTINEATIAIITAKIINQNGCLIEITKPVNTELLAAISLPETIKICQGEAVQLNPIATIANYEYQWLPLNNINNPNIANPVVSPTETTIYRLRYKDSIRQCFIEKAIQVEVLTAIQDFTVASTTNCDGRTVTFTPNQLSSLEWNFGDGSSIQNTNNESEITHTFPAAGNYAIKVTTNNQGICSNVITLPISLVERNIVANFDWSTENCTDTSIDLVLEDLSKVVHGNITNWNWELSNGLSSTESQATFPITTNETIELNLSIIVDNKPSCASIQTIRIPPLLIQKTIPDSVRSCANLPIALNPSPIENYDYNWFPMEGLNSNTSPNPIATIDTSAIYTVEVSNEYGCLSSQVVQVIIPPKINIQTIDSISICDLQQVTMVSATSEQAISKVEWLDQNGVLVGTTPEIDLSINETYTNLNVRLEDNFGCQEEKTIPIAYQAIVTTIKDSLFACYQTDLFLNENAEDSYQYSWSPAIILADATAPNPLVNLEQSTKFLVTITNGMGCDLKREIVVQVASEIIVEASQGFATCEEGTQTELYAYSNQVTQQWWLNSLGDTLGHEAELPFVVSETTQITAEIEGKFGCIKQKNIAIQYKPIELEYEPNQVLCKEESLQLLIENLHPSQELAFEWSPLASILEGADTNMPTIQPSTSTTYTFTAMNELGCKQEGNIAIEVIQEVPNISIEAAQTNIIKGTSIELSATNKPNYIYTWTPANTLNSNAISNPVATPTEDTEYHLEVRDENGCTNTATIKIQVQTALCESPYIFLPSGFTPNGDGENDVLFVRGEIIKELQFIIYDRWGDKLFETSNQDIGWDGTRNGRRLPSGVFGYYIYAGCFNGEEYYRQGNITLVR